MLFVVRRLQELGLQRKIPLYMCFVDLQTVYDSVDRELLWKVLALAGEPSVMIDIIRQFHDGMRARVCMDDEVLSEWFEVAHVLRCVSGPTIGGGRGYDDSVPGKITKTLPGIGLHDPLHDRQACPKFSSFSLGFG